MSAIRTVVGMIGDLVVVCPGEGRSVPPGVPVDRPLEIVGFDTIYKGRLSAFGAEPGLYLNKAYPILAVDGAEIAVSETYLDPAPGFGRRPYDAAAFRIGDLPETRFWEGDLVTHTHHGLSRVMRVDYENIGEFRTDGVTPMPTYTCEVPRAGSMFFQEEHLTLHRRGNVWRHCHGQPTSFASLDEAAKFHVEIGDRTPLPNVDGWSFTAEEALEELYSGRADCAYDGVEVFDRPRAAYQLVKIGNEEVGEACRGVAIEKLEMTISAAIRHGR